MSEQISLGQRIQCIKRELALRERAYPKFIASGKLKRGEAEFEFRAMRAVLRHLEADQTAGRDPLTSAQESGNERS